MADVTITHTHEDGTILTGSRKGDGVYEIARNVGQFRWSPAVGIYIRGSRDKDADRARINRVAEALHAAGHTVTINVDNTWRPAAEREADRGARMEERVERLDDAATRAAGRSVAARDARRSITDARPFGQPMMPGHHSYPADLRRQDRVHALSRRQYAEADKADNLASRAAGAAANVAHRQDPRAMMRRIEVLRAEVRGHQRTLDGHVRNFRNNSGEIYTQDVTPPATGAYAERVRDHLNRAAEEITHLEKKLAALEETGQFVTWTRDDFVKGDLANVGGRWCEVARINEKSVSVRGRWFHSTPEEKPVPVKWDEIHGRRRDGQQWDTPHGQPWPVVSANAVRKWAGLRTAAQHAHSYPYDSDAYRDGRTVGYTLRIVHGLPLDASDAELTTITGTLGTTREDLATRALVYLEVFARLTAGEPVPDVAATITPLAGAPAWRLPDGPTVGHRAGPCGWSTNDTQPLVQPGDLVKGYYDRGAAGTLFRGFCGPVASVSAVLHRREAGDWVTITLVDGTAHEFQTHQWLAVYPAGTW